ncbi:MAG: hypothetical protein A3G34_04275 [Candidatus Lindowbacteria bacterium RIFCSPLOWO2_12_FULL_62_27]|nr:MAG: hypothetical protein A3G34_04275 [Candidatus Lindowbacteria bacterium RIFCSPLOWO2_12_FULL_62_27]OGH63779.1 MAG: hypothetical protein A3I06_12720 [Candidatus Lindowbacteria bacterium RIFCSPLOWO2_02_FULL_62_12]
MAAAGAITVREETWDHRRIVRVIFDLPDKPVNVLTTETMRALGEVLGNLEQEPPSGLVLESAKPGVFIAGADIHEIEKIDAADAAATVAREGRDLLWKLHTIRCPTYAAIDGVALGGGLEAALFCDYRIVSDSPKTRVGLPEVTLGIIPGFGGTQTLPRLIGLQPALDLILTGRQIDGRRAEKLGLADRCVPHDTFQEEVEAFVMRHPKKAAWPRRSPPFFLIRELTCSMARSAVLKKTQGNYPAPLAAIAAVRRGLGRELSEGLRIETEIFSALPQTRECKNLIRTFFQMEKFKKYSIPRLEEMARARGKPAPARACAVIGAGTMGAGIAQHLSACGLGVRLKDIDVKFLQRGIGAAEKIVRGSLARKRIRREEARDILARILPTLDYGPLRSAELVIEAVLEDLPLKRKVFDDLERVTARGVVLATNTSSLPIGKIAEGRPAESQGRYIGLHFFNPVDKMPLVEIVVAPCTSDETLARALEFVKAIKKTPVVVKDRPGFLVNRVLMPYMNESAYLLSEGVRIDHIDRLALKFGMPMGPLHLLDVVGLDVGEKVSHVLHEAYGDRMAPCPLFERLRREGRLGQKNERGFYLYKGGKKQPDHALYDGLPAAPAIAGEDITDRLILTMVNEAARVLSEGVVDDAETVDVGMLLGTGFPPFRGGLLKYADDRGLQSCVDRLYAFSERHGARFAPCDDLVRLAKSGGRFHQETVR